MLLFTGLKLMDFAAQCMLAAKGCSEYPCTELVIPTAIISAQQEKGRGGILKRREMLDFSF